MVKGVNKNIIEVNNTGSRIFERIVFYISPEYNSLNAESINQAAKEIERLLKDEKDEESFESLRNRVKRKNRRLKFAFFLLLGIAFVSVTVGFIVFKR